MVNQSISANTLTNGVPKSWNRQSAAERSLTVEELLRKNKEKLQHALPKHFPPDKLISAVLTSIARNPELLDCTQTSLLGAVWTAAQLGLNPDGLLGEAYLNPHRNKNKSLECRFIPGYRGYIKLAYQSGHVKAIQAECVHANDFFEYEKGLSPKLVHRPARPPGGELIAVYVVVQLVNGGFLFDVMWKDEIELARRSNSNNGNSAWKNYYDEMAKKTVCRRILKITPLSTELELASVLDEKAEVLDASQRTGLALLDAGISPEIDIKIQDTLNNGASSAEKGKNSKAVNKIRINGEARSPQQKTEIKRAKDGVSFYLNCLKEAKKKGDMKLAEQLKAKLEKAVNKLNQLIKAKTNTPLLTRQAGGTGKQFTKRENK